jgi:hypothetical protein
MRNTSFFYLIALVSIIIACNSKPTVVEPVQTSNNESTPAESDKSVSHKVVVEEVVQTKKYTYLNVTEDKLPPYWIAISKAEVEKGETCIYTGGLKMRGFKSAELDRVFDELLLVSNISRLGSNKPLMSAESMSGQQSDDKAIKQEKIIPVKGATAISELLANPTKYEGKIITVTGRCTKINHQIMNRNWIHLQDDSKNPKELTITSQDVLDLGSVGIFEGKISLNKDFGAGYRYDIIMEEAKLK